jgi:hypothetical protein
VSSSTAVPTFHIAINSLPSSVESLAEQAIHAAHLTA